MKTVRKKDVRGRAGFVLLVCALVAVVALIASIPAGIVSASAWRRADAEAFRTRAEQLTSALAAFSATQVALRQEGYATIRDVTAARRSMPEAVSVTITGPHANEIYNSERCSVRDYVLASDEAAWEQALEAGSFRPANVTASDEVARKGVIADFQREVEAKLGAALAERVRAYNAKRAELAALRAASGRAPAQDREQVLRTLWALGREIDDTVSRELTSLGAVRSYPAFDPRRPAPSYLFYAPIVFFDPSVEYFCNGMVRLTVDASSLGASAARANRRAALVSGGFGLLALLAGAAGGLLLGMKLPRPTPTRRSRKKARR